MLLHNTREPFETANFDHEDTIAHLLAHGWVVAEAGGIVPMSHRLAYVGGDGTVNEIVTIPNGELLPPSDMATLADEISEPKKGKGK